MKLWHSWRPCSSIIIINANGQSQNFLARVVCTSGLIFDLLFPNVSVCLVECMYKRHTVWEDLLGAKKVSVVETMIGTLFALFNILPYFAIALFHGMPQNQQMPQICNCPISRNAPKCGSAPNLQLPHYQKPQI